MTIIAPLHNVGSEITDVLTRILRAAGDSAQVVLVDDASTDGTADAVSAFAADRANVVAVRNHVNLGVAGSRNVALTHADREYVWFVDHDDDWDDDILDVFAAAAEASPDIVVCRAEYRHDLNVPGRIIDGVDARATLDRSELLRLMLLGEVNGFLWSKLIRREVLGDNPFPHLSSQSDFVGFVRAVSASSRVALIPNVLYRYVRRESSITRVKNPRLSNLVVAHDALGSIVRTDAALGVDKDLGDYFTAWFYCAAAAFTPIRQGASQRVRREGILRAQAALAGMSVGSIARRNARLGITLMGIRYAAPLYSLSIAGLLKTKAMARALARSRRTR